MPALDVPADILRQIRILTEITLRRVRIFSPDDRDDCRVAGLLGGVLAYQSYDPSYGAALQTHLITRIRCAILTEARELDPMTREARRRDREGLPVPPRYQAPLSLDAILAERVGQDEVNFYVCDPWSGALLATDDPRETVLRRETARLLREAAEGLRPEWRRVIVGYYYEGRTRSELGQHEGITGQGIGDRLNRAREAMRAALTPAWEEGAL